MTSPARNRRENQPVPSTQSDAGARFKCEAYLCTMSGQTCRDYHANAMEFRPENRDACIDCPAGAARLVLLGRNGSAGQTAICTARTARGTLCCHPPVEGGLCHIHRGAAASKTRQAIAAGQETRMKKKTAAAPAKSPAKSAASPKKRPWMVKSGAHGITQTSAAPTCARAGCDRPTVPGTALSEYCRECVNTAYTSLRKSSGRTPTNAERAEWLASHPAMVKYRRRGAEPSAPDEVVALAPVPVLDVHVAVSPEVVDEVLAVEVEVEVEVVEVAVDASAADAPQDAGPDAAGGDLATVTFKINNLAFARLQAMAALGIYGDDPNDVARAAVFGWLQGFVWSDL